VSEQGQETQTTPPAGDEAPPQVEPLTPPDPNVTEPEPVGRTDEAEAGEPAPTDDAPHEPNDATTTSDDGEPKTDQEQGVGLAPTEPGDAGEGNPGTAFQTTEEIEAADLSKSGEVAGVQ
jgi:hypothetical protein